MVVIQDTTGRKYGVTEWTLSELDDEGRQRSPYILKDAVRRIFKGDSATMRVKVHGRGWGNRHTFREIKDGSISIGCRTFERSAALVIRGWAFE
jgi:hypothetical protein